MIVSFKDFLAQALQDEQVQNSIRQVANVDSVLRQLSVKTNSQKLISKKKRVLFGHRHNELLDLRFITSEKYKLLENDLNSKTLAKINEHNPSMGDIATACAHDVYSTPLLLSTSSDLISSNVWVDEHDRGYIFDMVQSIVFSMSLFESDIEKSDRRKKEMQLHIMPAGISEGIMFNADEICHKGGTIAYDGDNLDVRQIRDRISVYNSRLDIYKRILEDEAF